MTLRQTLRSLAILAALPPLAASAESPKVNPIQNIVPPGQPAVGKTLGEWGAEWWRWSLALPASQNPILDPDGRFGALNQSGPVWFLAGNFGGRTERSVSVPPGKHLFFPLYNACYWAPEDLVFLIPYMEFLGYTPEQIAGFSDEEILNITTAAAIDTATNLTLTINDRPASSLFAYRGQSEPFQFYLGDLYEPFGYPPGDRFPAVSDGYWIMIRPLPPGRYKIRFTASADDGFFGQFRLDVSYNVTIGRN